MAEKQKNDRITRTVRHFGIAVFLLLAALASLWSQQAMPAQHPASAINPPFAALDESMVQTANALLASARQAAQAVPVAMGSGAVHTTMVNPAIQYGGRWRSWPANSPAPALSRIAGLSPVIDPILHEEGVPAELAAVVLVESGGDPMALSSKGARGLWQLMPDTARRYGLIVNSTEDDRLDVEKSTRAAAHYLRDLHSEFGSWPLALAAYNTGAQNLQYAIERSPSRNFLVLSSLGLLPLETRNYVPAVFAAEERFTEPTAAAQHLIPRRREGWIVFAITEPISHAR